MYLRAIHAESHIPTIRALIRDNPLGILVTALPSTNFPTIQCTHMPWVLDVDDESSESELGTLRGHLARPNPHSKAMMEAILATSPSNEALEGEVSVIFTGPVHSYVTPQFYQETKPATGKVVPTWNYSAAQAYGKAKIFFDTKNPETGEFLHRQTNDLTRLGEEDIMKYTGGERLSAWKPSDAPDRYIELLQKNIIGIEISITRLEGKFKMSQESSKEDREGVINGFEALETENGRTMAEAVRERGALKDAKSGSRTA